jgi:transcriptional regulator CtsR
MKINESSLFLKQNSIMALSEHADRLRKLIEKAIDDHQISRAEYDDILNMALEDGVIDSQEQALLDQLQEMIANKSIKIIP